MLNRIGFLLKDVPPLMIILESNEWYKGFIIMNNITFSRNNKFKEGGDING